VSGERIRIGISSCLLGQRVRYDSNHKHDSYITGTLGQYFEFVPVCPEVAIGLGVPRPPIQLAGDPGQPRARGVRDPAMDVTDALQDYGRRMAGELTDISGYIFKSRSPSCGMERVKVYGPQGGGAAKQGVGLYAQQIMAARPLLPVEEEGRLGDPGLRDNFLERVFAYRRWQQQVRQGLCPAALVDFHTRHKLSLMAHGQGPYRALGRLVADAGRKRGFNDLCNRYISEFTQALKHRATVRRHTNVLQHLLGYLRRDLDGDDRQELADTIDRYRRGEVPRIVPVTLLKHHFRRHPDPYVEDQLYLNPPSDELMLRSYL